MFVILNNFYNIFFFYNAENSIIYLFIFLNLLFDSLYLKGI